MIVTLKAFLKLLLRRNERGKGVVVPHRKRSHTPYKTFPFIKRRFFTPFTRLFKRKAEKRRFDTLFSWLYGTANTPFCDLTRFEGVVFRL